jgi:hypothetical protein
MVQDAFFEKKIEEKSQFFCFFIIRGTAIASL